MVTSLTIDLPAPRCPKPSAIPCHVFDPEWLHYRREIESFFIQEVDRDKVLAGSALD